MGPGKASVVQARWAIMAVFGINGALIASLAVRTPSLKLDLDLSTGQLGLGSAFFGIAAVTAMQGAGGLAARVGTARIVRATLLGMPMVLIGVGIAPGFGQLSVIFVVIGVLHGMLDVTMNAHAVAVERCAGGS